MQKKITTILFSLIMFLALGISVNAEGKEIYSEQIPDRMMPYSEIIFTDSCHFEIIKGGLYADSIKSDGVKTGGIPDPVAGVTVTYASDGYIQDIEFPDGIVNPLLQQQALIDNVDQPSSRTVIPDGYSIVASWGSHNNTLYQNESQEYRIGVGRATTFTDQIGQANITNDKDSVATKRAYDDVDVWTVVRVSTINSNGVTYARNMNKTDAGGMPDAIVDIWKTGVEYWGYTWSSSFSMPYTVTIGHDY